MRTPPLPSLRALAAATIAGAIAMTPATAQAQAQAQDVSGQITLYGWGAGVSGDFTPVAGGPTLAFDKSLSEVLEDLDGAFFVTGLARFGDLVLLGDFTYTTSSRAGVVPPGISAAGEVEIRSLTLAAGRRFDAGGGSSIDVLGGLRAWRLDGQVAALGLAVERGSSFVDPIIALRGTAPLSERWSMIGYIDVGGFGVGSDVTWQASVTANYQATENLYLSIGWRHLYLDYSDGRREFDGALSGPLIGATWRF